MKLIELFAGSKSIGKVAEQRGHTVFSVDINDFPGIDLVKDIEYLTLNDLPFIPDVGWASPMCTTYSIAAISHHRDGQTPKSDFAKKSDRVILNTLKIFNDVLKVNPNFIFYIENPRGMLRKMDFMAELDRATVCYCKYGDIRMKPTDIWSNNIKSAFNPSGWEPREMCFNGNPNCHHQRAPRGSRTGTQGLKGNYERSKIPEQLCEEIIMATELRVEHGQ